MLFRYDASLHRSFSPVTEPEDLSPAALTLCLVRSLAEWCGLRCRTLSRRSPTELLVGWPELRFSTEEFSETFGPLLARIGADWPIMAFGLADTTELISLAYPAEDEAVQHSISGCWQEELCGLCLALTLPDEESALAMEELLRAVDAGRDCAVLDWSHRSFLEAQRLTEPDRTLTFCYVPLGPDSPEARLGGLCARRKQQLWRLFLERQVCPPEFEWLWDVLKQEPPADWIEWSLSLYQALEELGFRLRCEGGCFTLLDGQGRRRYFSVDHAAPPERVLMKILYPLNT